MLVLVILLFFFFDIERLIYLWNYRNIHNELKFPGRSGAGAQGADCNMTGVGPISTRENALL